jgi:hypothetical protein
LITEMNTLLAKAAGWANGAAVWPRGLPEGSAKARHQFR